MHELIAPDSAIDPLVTSQSSLCSSSDIGGGRSISTLLLPMSLVAESTACVCRFRRLSFLFAPSLGRTVEICREWRVSFMGLGLGF